MALQLYLGDQKEESKYFDKKSKLSPEEYHEKLQITSTIYIGNLSIATSEDSLIEFFSRAGNISSLHMGMNKQGLPAGFCFIVYSSHQEAKLAVQFLNQLKLEDRVIRVDLDVGFDPSRQHGRGENGLQIRDCMRKNEDKQRLNLSQQNKQQWQQRGGVGFNNNYNRNNSNNRRFNNNNNSNNNNYNNYNNNNYRNNRGNSFNNQGGNRPNYNKNNFNRDSNNKYQNNNYRGGNNNNNFNSNRKYSERGDRDSQRERENNHRDNNNFSRDNYKRDRSESPDERQQFQNNRQNNKKVHRQRDDSEESY